jgi:plastocyanin
MRGLSIWVWAGLIQAAVVAAAGLGCGSSYGGGGTYGAPAPAQCSAATATALTSGTVTLAGMAFAPACAKVAAGTTVTFANDDAVAHTVTADSGAFDSGNVAPGTAFSHRFDTAGTVGIHCMIHAGMRMTLFVGP